MILIHYTAFTSIEKTIRLFQRSTSQVSAHYIIEKNGEVVQMVRDKDQAFHAGLSHWKGKKSCNRFSIGIELVNKGEWKKVIPYTQEQYDSLVTLCRRLIRKYSIPQERILGHSDVAIPLGRKRDPGTHFDWEYFARKGIGRMPEPPSLQSLQHASFSHQHSASLHIGMKGTEVRRLQRNLKKTGYQIRVDGNFGPVTRKVVKAFQRHFRRQKMNGIADLETVARIKTLSKK